MEKLQLQAQPRTAAGKEVRFLRRKGLTPIHVYGKEIPSLTLQAETSVLKRVVARAGRNVPVTLTVDGDEHFTFVREIQRHPITGDLLHVDFHRVSMLERMRTEIAIRLVGEAPAIRLHNGALLQNLHWVEVECLPVDVPEVIDVDVSGLDDMEKAIYVRDLKVGPNVEMLSDLDTLVARVNPLKIAVEEAVPAKAEAAAPAEGEAEAGKAAEGAE